MKILLHVCCAPCAIHPFKELIENNENQVTGFFYNPNIHLAEEEDRRRQALTEYAKKENFEVIFGAYDAKDFFERVGSNQEAPSRCKICWRMRLEKTAEVARSGNFDAFTTTLLVSPYQNQDTIVQIGHEVGSKSGIKFLAIDFREGFKGAQQQARQSGIYRQKYCGCTYSREERERCRK